MKIATVRNPNLALLLYPFFGNLSIIEPYTNKNGNFFNAFPFIRSLVRYRADAVINNLNRLPMSPLRFFAFMNVNLINKRSHDFGL